MLGYIHLPSDRRQTPLVTTALDLDGKTERDFKSFALQTVNAYEDSLRIAPRTEKSKAIQQAIENDYFVYGSFLNSGEFPSVRALDLLNRRAEAMEALNHRIVMIGGNLHTEYHGEVWMDRYESPAGPMSGVYFHANYVESLLDNRVKLPTPEWFAASFDLALGSVLIFFFKRAVKPSIRLAILGLFFVPLVAAYFIFVNLNRCLDFILPLGLLFLHLGIEHYRELRHEARIGKEVLEHGR